MANLKLEGTVPKTTLTSDTNCEFRGLSKTLRVNNLLEKLRELMKTLILTVVVYYKGKIPIKISQEDRHIRQRPGEGTNVELPLSSPYWVMDVLLCWHQCVTVCTELSPTREAHASLRVKSVYRGLINGRD